MKILFYLCLLSILYVYFGYPLLLLFLSCFTSRKIIKAEIEPNISIIISAFNEEKNIASKIDASLNLDYRMEKLEVIVVSDGSTDKTDEIVKGYAEKGVRLIRIEGRKGKTEAQNQAVKLACGEIILFSDATTYYNKDVIKKIVGNFADQRVGCVGGALSYVDGDGTEANKNEGAYWKYEKKLKEMESKFSSLIGVSGCLYAVRKKLYEAIPADQISDFVIALIIYKKGYFVIYEKEAVSFESVTAESRDEFSMRVRVALRSLHGLWYKKELLNPFKYRFYAVQLLSHKFSRYLAPIFLMMLFISNAFLTQSLLYQYVFYGQVFFYSAAFLGWILPLSWARRLKIYIPFYFCMINAAVFLALMKFLAGQKQVKWETVR